VKGEEGLLLGGDRETVFLLAVHIPELDREPFSALLVLDIAWRCGRAISRRDSLILQSRDESFKSFPKFFGRVLQETHTIPGTTVDRATWNALELHRTTLSQYTKRTDELADVPRRNLSAGRH